MKNIPARLLPKVVVCLIILVGMVCAYMKKNEYKMIYKAKDSKIEKAKDTNPPRRYQSIDKEKYTLE